MAAPHASVYTVPFPNHQSTTIPCPCLNHLHCTTNPPHHHNSFTELTTTVNQANHHRAHTLPSPAKHSPHQTNPNLQINSLTITEPAQPQQLNH
ncbi:hypothetical protein M0R45_011574 [Rubus argutus]|uniref:Uncharacterized protein n=1 Tax=Rubus argutus TaxID=59490 RepID=A0AAW1YE10_RUBAR